MRDAVEALGKAEPQAARSLLELLIPVIEAANGGPTTHTAHLRTVLGEFCEDLQDLTSAIAAYLGVTAECGFLLKPRRLLATPGFNQGPPWEGAYGNLGLAYKRSGMLDKGRACYHEGLHGVRQRDLSEGPQHLRWNLYKLLLDAEDEETQVAAFTLFGGQDAISERLLLELPRHTLVQQPEEIIASFYNTQIVARLLKNNAPVGKCLVSRISSKCPFTVEAVPPEPEDAAPQNNLQNIKTKPKAMRSLMCNRCDSRHDRSELLKCPCHTKFYCTKECQKKAWPEYKKAHNKIMDEQ